MTKIFHTNNLELKLNCLELKLIELFGIEINANENKANYGLYNSWLLI